MIFAFLSNKQFRSYQVCLGLCVQEVRNLSILFTLSLWKLIVFLWRQWCLPASISWPPDLLKQLSRLASKVSSGIYWFGICGARNKISLKTQRNLCKILLHVGRGKSKVFIVSCTVPVYSLNLKGRMRNMLVTMREFLVFIKSTELFM